MFESLVQRLEARCLGIEVKRVVARCLGLEASGQSLDVKSKMLELQRCEFSGWRIEGWGET